MKKSKLLLYAAAAMILAGCGTNTNQNSSSNAAKNSEASSSQKTSEKTAESSEQTPVKTSESSSGATPVESSEPTPVESSESSSDTDPSGAKEYIFEAECVDLDDFEGAGYSGGATMAGAILTDWYGTAQASSGYWISYMYVNNLAIEFDITSDAEVNDAKLVLRLSGEVLETVSFTDKEFTVSVNDEALEYGTIEISGCNTDLSADWVRPFTDYTVSTSCHLKKGENVIELKTTNQRAMAGTMYATAPMIDCIKVTTSATLTWDPVMNKKPFPYVPSSN